MTDMQTHYEQIAQEFGKNPTQRKAILAALAHSDATLQSQREDATTVIEKSKPIMWTPKAKTLVFVLSGPGTTGRDDAEMRSRLEYTQERLGDICVVTLGRRNVEEAAEHWAVNRKVEFKRISALWEVPYGDGTTWRDSNARQPRNLKLRELVPAHLATEGNRALVWCWGVEEQRDLVERMLVRAGCRPRVSSPFFKAEQWPLEGAAAVKAQDDANPDLITL